MSAAPPITPEQMHALALAEERERGFRGARKLARWNGVGFAVCAALALVFAWVDPWTGVTGLVLAAFAFVELRGGRLLAAYDRRAPTMLCLNQVAFCLVIGIYAVVQVLTSLSAANPVESLLQNHPDLVTALESSGFSNINDFVQDFGPMYRTGIVLFYAAVVLLTLLFQGGSALYYASRKKRLDAFLADTPAWVIDYKRMSQR